MGIRDTTRFPPSPDPDDCIGLAGVTSSVVIAVVGLTWLFIYQGRLARFGLIILAAFVGWGPFRYCEPWGRFRVRHSLGEVTSPAPSFVVSVPKIPTG